MPRTLRRSRLASDFSFLPAASAGLAFALFSCLIFFFSESVSLSGTFFTSLGGMVTAIARGDGTGEERRGGVPRRVVPRREG